MDRQLIKRNTVEVVTDDELETVLKKKRPKVYCGYETSGPVHIGHMVTVNKLLDMQNAGFEVTVLFADTHTLLNRKGSKDWIDGMAQYWRECFCALGLDSAKFIRGSSFQFERQYIEDVLRLSVSTSVKRALRSMQEVTRDINNARVSQMIYPLMQIADIKALDADVAYGGIEQRKIHMLARETLGDIGGKKPVCIHTPLICSLAGPESKMSSSDPKSIIGVDEDENSIIKKVSKAYCPVDAENNPVLDMARLIICPRMNSIRIKRPQKFGGDVEYDSYDSIEKAYLGGKLHAQDLKKGIGEALAGILAQTSKKISKLKMPED